MSKIKNSVAMLSGLAVCAISPYVLSAGSIEGSVYIETLNTDNARRSATDEFSERQDQIGLNLEGEYEFSNAQLEADYEVFRNRFNDDSQDDRAVWGGGASLTVGEEEDTFGLLLSHTRRQILQGENQISLLENIDERNILLARPSARFKVTPVDIVSLNGNFADVSFRFVEPRDTRRTGADLTWRHRLSEIDAFEVTLEQTQVEFPNLNSFDYDYQVAFVAYESRQRLLGYRVEVGYNETDPDVGEDSDGVFLDLAATYGNPENNLALNANRSITDTSIGNGNDEFFSDLGSGDGALGIQDRIERTSLDLLWSYGLLCSRCELQLGLGLEVQDYNQQDVEDNTEIFFDVGFNYRLFREGTLGLEVTYRDQDYDEPVRESFSDYTFRIDYSHQFANNFEGRVFVIYQERDADIGLFEYDESAIGIRLSYSF